MGDRAREIADALQWLINYYPKWNGAADPCDCMEQAIEVIKELSAEVEQKWISVEDRLPEDDQDVLICVRGQTIDTGYYSHGYWEAYACMSNDVTHWMPLPELPDKD